MEGIEFGRDFPNGTQHYEAQPCPYVQSNLLFIDYLRIVYITNCIFNTVFSLVAVFGNTLVFFSIRRTQSLHDPSHLLLAILACTDLSVGLIQQPMYVLYKTAELNKLARISCVSGAISNMLTGLLAGMSFLTMTLISIDRFLALHLHLRYKAIVTRSLVLKVTSTCFVLFALGVSFYPWMPDVSVYLGMTSIPLCLMVSTILYCKIYKIVRRHQLSIEIPSRHQHEPTNLKRYWKSVVSFVYVHIIMVICYLPYALALVTRVVLGITKEYKLALNITTTVIYLNSSLNPFVYCWRIKEVRKAVVRTLKQLFGKPLGNSQVTRIQASVSPHRPYLVPSHITEADIVRGNH